MDQYIELNTAIKNYLHCNSAVQRTKQHDQTNKQKQSCNLKE